MCWAEQDASPALYSHCLDPCKVCLGFPCRISAIRGTKRPWTALSLLPFLSSGSIMVCSSTATYNSGIQGLAQFLHPLPSPSITWAASWAVTMHCPARTSFREGIACPPGVSRQGWSMFLKSGSKVVLHLLFISATAECSWSSLSQHIHQAKLSANAADMQL